MEVSINELEAEYKKQLDKMFVGGKPSNIDELIDASVTLFREIKITEIALMPEAEMLVALYLNTDRYCGKTQYLFNITRYSTIIDNTTYILSMSLLLEPIACLSNDAYVYLSPRFDSTETWATSIKKSKGYKLANHLNPMDFTSTYTRTNL